MALLFIEELIRIFSINFFKRMIASHTFIHPKLPGQSLPWATQSLVRQRGTWAVFTRLGEKHHKGGYKQNTTGAEREGGIFFQGELRRVSPKEATMVVVTPWGGLLGTSVWIQRPMRMMMITAQVIITSAAIFWRLCQAKSYSLNNSLFKLRENLETVHSISSLTGTL